MVASNKTDIQSMLDGMTHKELHALLRQLQKKTGAIKEEPEISPSDARLEPLAAELRKVNKELGMKSVATVNLLMRRLRLGYSVTRNEKLKDKPTTTV